LCSLYFDGHKEKTTVQEKVGTKFYCWIDTEEQDVSILEIFQFGTKYSIVDFIPTNYMQTATLSARRDHIAMIFGTGGGVIRLIVAYHGRLLLWMCCQLHAKELPLQHLCQYFDGHTTGPHCLSDIIRKHLNGCEQLQTMDFFLTETSLPETLFRCGILMGVMSYPQTKLHHIFVGKTYSLSLSSLGKGEKNFTWSHDLVAKHTLIL
jgi:hypothetical protein